MRRAAAIIAFLAVLLAVDTQVGAGLQLVLGGATWVALWLACRSVPRLLWAQALVVVAVATCAEFVGSIVWGVYTYRLENLPSFVPPAHGLVYLAGASIAAAASNRLLQRRLVALALVLVVGWGIAGVTVLPREDVGGAIGAALLAIYLVWGRAPHRLRRRVPRGCVARALRHRARHLGVGARDPRRRRSRTATRRAASRAATCGSTSSRWRSRRGCSRRGAACSRATGCHSVSAGSEKPILRSGSATPIVS